MAIIDADYNSNTYFFLTNFSDVLKAGKNSFIINPTPYVVPNANIVVKAYDTANNELPCGEIKPTNALFSEQTNTGKFYYVNVFEGAANGFGRLEIRSTGVSLDNNFNGIIAYYNGLAYAVPSNTRLPLTQAPASSPLPQTEVVWSRNVLIDTTKKTDSEVRFFDTPFIRVRPEIYSSPLYPTGSYRLATGNFSSVAVNPKHNANGDYDYQFDEALYQLYWQSGTKFSSIMEGGQVRIKNPTVTKFKYSEYQDLYQGVLNTDFIAKIKKVVNEDSILLDIPFATVSELITRTNEDSPYAKNNLVKLKGYTVSDDPTSQTVFHKNNFYILSITNGEFEIFYNDIPVELPRADPSGSGYLTSLLNIEFNNVRALCGALDSYKIYGRSLNSPESKALLMEGKIEPDQVIRTNKFDNALRGNPAHFYSQAVMNKHWFIKGACSLSQDNSVLIDGAIISHAANSSLADYVIYKDNTDAASQNDTYVSYNILPNSYWYANADAFVNYKALPTASYNATSSIASISSYGASQENLLSGTAHDCNSIKLRANTLYKFSMNVKAAGNNSNAAKLYIYYISGEYKKMIGYIDSSYNYGANTAYQNTFFSDTETFGTILLVPVLGSWHISSPNIEPYMSKDYSIDSFAIKVPIRTYVPNEYYEIETELYDAQNRLAYGRNSYTFTYNKRFMPLKNNVFMDPTGTVMTIILDGGSSST